MWYPHNNNCHLSSPDSMHDLLRIPPFPAPAYTLLQACSTDTVSPWHSPDKPINDAQTPNKYSDCQEHSDHIPYCISTFHRHISPCHNRKPLYLYHPKPLPLPSKSPPGVPARIPDPFDMSRKILWNEPVLPEYIFCKNNLPHKTVPDDHTTRTEKFCRYRSLPIRLPIPRRLT